VAALRRVPASTFRGHSRPSGVPRFLTRTRPARFRRRDPAAWRSERDCGCRLTAGTEGACSGFHVGKDGIVQHRDSQAIGGVFHDLKPPHAENEDRLACVFVRRRNSFAHPLLSIFASAAMSSNLSNTRRSSSVPAKILAPVAVVLE